LDRGLLAALAISPMAGSSVESLIDALWGTKASPAAAKAVRNKVSELRRRVGAEFIETVHDGYRLGPRVRLDVHDFEDDTLSEAQRLALWRGRPLVELDDWERAQTIRARLLQRRAALQERALARRLDGGADAEQLLGEIEALIDDDPYRERRWVLLMRALYLAGRQRDALIAFDRARRLLDDELDVNPGDELVSMRRLVLTHDPSLAPSRARRRVAIRPANELIGRTIELSRLDQLMRVSRFITISGLGGIGKTRLALELAGGHHGEAHIVDLSEVDVGGDVAGAVATVVGLAVHGTPLDAVVSWASAAKGLLVLDNCEHVRADAGALATTIISAGPDVHIVATSRVPVGAVGETTFELGPLRRSDAVSLYRRAATAIDDGDGHVIDQLCAAVSDVPLAIELAAARSRVLSPAEILARLDVEMTSSSRSSTILSDPDDRRPRRQRSVAAVVAWSTDARSERASAVFRRTAVFSAGFTLDAAQSVAGFNPLSPYDVLDGIAELAVASLIEVRRAHTTRYRTLDLVRARGVELLDRHGEREVCQRRFVDWAASTSDLADYADMPRLLLEIPNLVAAIRLACHNQQADRALAIAAATYPLECAEHFELIDWTRAAVELPDADQDGRYPRTCAKLATAMTWYRPDRDAALDYAQRALAHDPDGDAAGWARLALGHLHGDLTSIRLALDLAIEHDVPMLELSCRNAIALSTAAEHPAGAWEHAHSAERLAARISEPWADVMATLTYGAALCHVDPDAAVEHFDRGATLATRHGYQMLSTVGRTIAGFAAATRSPLDRITIVCQGLSDAASSHSHGWLQLNLQVLARAFAELGQHERAALLAQAVGAEPAHRPLTPETAPRVGEPAEHRSHRSDRPSVAELLEQLDHWRDELARSHTG
jgi:predicted ATPase/DNA-binding SARP family transcriptional activator